MKRWTNGLPGATKRLGAMMAQRGLSASQPRMRADTHDGPEQMLHVRGLIHCCSSHVRRSWSFCLATHGPGHTYDTVEVPRTCREELSNAADDQRNSASAREAPRKHAFAHSGAGEEHGATVDRAPGETAGLVVA